MRFPVPSSLKASGSSFCFGERGTLDFFFKNNNSTHLSNSLKGSHPSEVKVRLVLTTNTIIRYLQKTIFFIHLARIHKLKMINSIIQFNHILKNEGKKIRNLLKTQPSANQLFTCSSSAVSISSPVRSSILWLIVSIIGSS